MALIIPVGYAQCVYELELAGDDEQMVTTIGLDISGAGSDFQQIANDAMGAFQSNLLGLISNQYTLTGVSLYVGQDGGPPAIFESTAPPATGGEASEALPQNCAYLLRKRTSAAGRRGRGRMYIPGVDETQVGPTGQLSSIWLADIQDNADAFLATLNTGGVSGPIPPVVLHRSEGTGIEPPPTPITALVFDQTIATQRRRLRK